MSRLAGIHDLAYCFTRLQAGGGAAYSGDWVGLGANLGALAGKAMWYGRNQIKVLADALKTQGTKTLPTPTAIVDVAMVAISAVDLLNGFWTPDKGASFTGGADKYETVFLYLAEAAPDPRDWSGDAAKAYADATAALQALVQTMQDLDKKMQTLVADQGSEVAKAHNAIAVTLLGLVIAQGIALALYLIPVVGHEISAAWQIIAAFAACATVLAFEMFTLSNSMSLAHQIHAVALEYGEVAEKAIPTSSFARIEVTGAEETKTGDFAAVSNSLSAFSAAPTVASLAGLAPAAGDSPEERGVLGALKGEGAAAVETAQTTPVWMPPALSQVTQASGQLAQPMNFANQMMGQVQQLASTGQPRPRMAPAAGEEPGDGAALGTAGGERAPVDGAGVGTGAAPGTSRPQRVL
ncbi:MULTISPECIES: EspA/EspE family type VII secretion system effector [unclassified Mycobacterium]|uniref:EspA/EspE family type VII secretion system effector n=1 Tax=unclassified Mycobacterium TaxID=2642494 RepID=UPI000AB0CA8C|nr:MULTISPECIES: EspA/EspE family type VII secretion system effector [unclassified Mycobacterium]